MSVEATNIPRSGPRSDWSVMAPLMVEAAAATAANAYDRSNADPALWEPKLKRMILQNLELGQVHVAFNTTAAANVCNLVLDGVGEIGSLLALNEAELSAIKRISLFSPSGALKVSVTKFHL